jgi:hypothetical protein
VPDTSPHDWLRQKLTALFAEAQQAGIAPDVTVAVINDLVNAPPFNTAPPETDENWNRDIGEPDYMVNEDTAGFDPPARDGDHGLTKRLQNFRIGNRSGRQ